MFWITLVGFIPSGRVPSRVNASNRWSEQPAILTHWPLGDLNEILDKYFELIPVIESWGIACKIALTWIPTDLVGDKSILVHVIAWCRQTTSHCLSRCWPRSTSPYVVTRPQPVIWEVAIYMKLSVPGTWFKSVIYEHFNHKWIGSHETKWYNDTYSTIAL